jgi:hypothetical protein
MKNTKKDRALRLLNTIKSELHNGITDGIDNQDLYLIISYAELVEDLIK